MLKWYVIVFFVLISGENVKAQAPLGTPHFFEGAAFGDRAAMLDLNRDSAADVVVPGPGTGLFMVTLNEDGERLGANLFSGSPGNSPGGTLGSSVLALAAGKIDSDFREDLVVFTNEHELLFFSNLGASQVDRLALAPSVSVENFSGVLTAPPVTSKSNAPVLEISDYDGDQINDIIFAVSQPNVKNAFTSPGFFRFYKGNGDGTFQTFLLNLPGNIIDAQSADLDGDQIKDHFVILTETGGSGVFAYEIIHAEFSNGSLFFSNFPQGIGVGKFTSLEIGDVFGDSNKDYILSRTSALNGGLISEVVFFEGDGHGVVGPNYGSFQLPLNSTGLGDHIDSIKIADLNGDHFDDLLVLRGYFSPASALGANPAQMADADLFVAMGPNLSSATFESISIPGQYRPTWAEQGAFLFMRKPTFSIPNMIRIADLGSNGRPDIFLQGLSQTLFVAGVPHTVAGGATIKNTLGALPATGGFEKVGNASGGVPGFKGRIGFDGGRPAIGNQNFAVTLQNIRGGSLVGLMWGSAGIPALAQVEGIDINVTPEVFGNLAIASGTELGQGFFSYPLPIPNSPSLIGAAGFFQYNYYDSPTAKLGATQGSGVIIE